MVCNLKGVHAFCERARERYSSKPTVYGFYQIHTDSPELLKSTAYGSSCWVLINRLLHSASTMNVSTESLGKDHSPGSGSIPSGSSLRETGTLAKTQFLYAVNWRASTRSCIVHDGIVCTVTAPEYRTCTTYRKKRDLFDKRLYLCAGVSVSTRSVESNGTIII